MNKKLRIRKRKSRRNKNTCTFIALLLKKTYLKIEEEKKSMPMSCHYY